MRRPGAWERNAIIVFVVDAYWAPSGAYFGAEDVWIFGRVHSTGDIPELEHSITMYYPLVN